MPTLYLHPDTGELLDDPVAWAPPIPDVDVGVEAPLIVRCQLHGQYEHHDRIVGALHIERSAETVLDFARCLLAASSGSCRTYRAWVPQLDERYLTRLEAIPRAQRPLASYLLIADIIASVLPHADALAALAAMPLPDLPPATYPVGRQAILDLRTGTITLVSPSERAPAGMVSLPRGRQWLLAPCRNHGWDLFGRLGAPSGRTQQILTHYARVVIATSVASCDDLRARTRLMRIDPVPECVGRALDALRYYRDFAGALHQVTHDTAWVVGEILDEITRRNR